MLHLGPGERLQVQVVRTALGALVGDLDDDGALRGVRVAAARLVAQLRRPHISSSSTAREMCYMGA